MRCWFNYKSCANTSRIQFQIQHHNGNVVVRDLKWQKKMKYWTAFGFHTAFLTVEVCFFYFFFFLFFKLIAPAISKSLYLTSDNTNLAPATRYSRSNSAHGSELFAFLCVCFSGYCCFVCVCVTIKSDRPISDISMGKINYYF